MITGSGTTWGNAVAAAILAANPDSGSMTAGEQSDLQNYWIAICSEHVTHLVSNTSVLPGTFVAGAVSVTGVGAVS